MQSNAAKAGLLAALAAVAVVLFIVLSGGDDSDSDSDTTTTEPVASTGTVPAPPADKPEAVEISFQGGAPVGGVQEIEVSKGDRVELAVRSDEHAELHVHGYELEKELVAGGVTRLSFDADIDGKFEIEAHSHTAGDVPLGELTVQPG